MSTTFQFIQIPKSNNVTVDIIKDTLQEAIQSAKEELDMSFEWIIYSGSKSLGFIEHTKYTCAFGDKPESRKFKRLKDTPNSLFFDTEAEAIADRNKYRSEADNKLSEIEADLNAVLLKHKQHKACLSYVMSGDTHGIHEDYMYISVEVNGYHFTRKIQD